MSELPGVPEKTEEWKGMTRTVFERIARKINQEITKNIISKPSLIKEYLLFGENEFESIKFKYKIKTMDEFIHFLKMTNQQKPYIWISGKTLQGYWNNGNAKDRKLNALLSFLNISINDWDYWKSTEEESSEATKLYHDKNNNGTRFLLRKHFVGHYFRYYQKSDQSRVLIKTPFVIKEDAKHIVTIETKTIGHQYESSNMVIRDGALYIECENLEWNEKENYIFNIGFETNPKIISGVSNTLDRKGHAIAIKNLLVKQETPYDYYKCEGMEIPFDQPLNLSEEDTLVLNFIKQRSNNIITTSYIHSLEELRADTIFKQIG
ncbi:hypothetical protein [Fulvivirga sediminis]|uniref:Uncharacterized protein n=1 Tax=Fulvivirga sediminis TaxID=2803949 RepID=A0A937K045_9BACT|nr:hypothetical protein [Fulvivirga sediminis]MBL3657998.1 hypothetical protein [Fulvivirga sediminis]